jgi:hypothetical protein
MNAVVKEAQPLAPGIYEGVPMETYLAMPAASASMMITLLTSCPRAAWFGSWLNPRRPHGSSTPAQSVGTLAHALLLENSKAQLAVIDPNDYPAEKTGNIPDGWTNKAIRAARDTALAKGMIPVFPATASAVEAMVAEARVFLSTLADSEPAIHDLFQRGGGRSEVTIVWEEDGCLFRIRPDRLAITNALMGDVKTTKTVAEPDRWGRTQLFGMHYYIAAAFYRRGLMAATGKRSKYVYLAQEQDPPHLCSLIGLDPAAELLGERRCDRAVAIWKDCMKQGRFPGYPNRVAYPETPSWEMKREEAEELGIAYDISKAGWQEAREFVEREVAPGSIGFDGENAPLFP